MIFIECRRCKNYRLIEEDGLCRTCYNEGNVKIRLDIISGGYVKDKASLTAIAESIDSVRGVECSGLAKNPSDDLDIDSEYCRLYDMEKKFFFDDYSGDKKQKIKSAINDALTTAREEYS